MAKETYYFPHDYEPTSDPKIQAMIGQYGASGYGLYWRIVEMLHSDESHALQVKNYVVLAIAKQMLIDADFVTKFIDDCVHVFELFTQNHDTVICDRVMRNIKHREDIRNKRKAAGSKGGVANAKQMLSNAKAKSSKGKEKKGKENIEDNTSDFDIFWDIYGKKNDREKCLKKFLTLTHDEVVKAIEKAKLYVSKTPDIQFRKNPLTWLNGKCWNDDYSNSTLTQNYQAQHASVVDPRFVI